MRFAERLGLVLVATACLHADGQALIHAQRYAMGTMFDIVAYHASGARSRRHSPRSCGSIMC